MDTFASLSNRLKLLVLSLYYTDSRYCEWSTLANCTKDAEYAAIYEQGVRGSHMPPLGTSPALVASLVDKVVEIESMFATVGGAITTRHDTKLFYPKAVHGLVPFLSHVGNRTIYKLSPFISIYHNNIPEYDTFLAHINTINLLRAIPTRMGHIADSAFNPVLLGSNRADMAHAPVAEVDGGLIKYHAVSSQPTSLNKKAFDTFCRAGLLVSASWPTDDITSVVSRPSVLPAFSDAAIIFGVNHPIPATMLPTLQTLATRGIPVFLYSRRGVLDQFTELFSQTDYEIVHSVDELIDLVKNLGRRQTASHHDPLLDEESVEYC